MISEQAGWGLVTDERVLLWFIGGLILIGVARTIHLLETYDNTGESDGQ